MEITTIHQSIEDTFKALPCTRFKFLHELFLLTAKDTYDAIYTFLEKEVAYALQAKCLTRTLMEILFNILFIAEDAPSRSVWYTEVGYKKQVEERKRFESRWNDRSQWAQEQIASYKAVEELLENALQLSNTDPIKNWPTPSRMLKMMRDKSYFEYVYECFYGSSSELIHGGFKSHFYTLTKRAGVMNEPRVITDFYSKAATFFLSIMSEIATLENIDMNELLKKAWGNLYQNVGPHLDKLIELRYSHFVENPIGPT